MHTTQSRWTSDQGWNPRSLTPLEGAQVVLVFGGRHVIERADSLDELRECYPGAHIIGCSTAGEICDVEVTDDSLVATALQFERSRVAMHVVTLEASANDSRRAGAALAQGLEKTGLRHVLILSDGTQVNGSELVQGIAENLPSGVTVSGGLSGDGDRFERTFVLADGPPRQGTIAALALYGASLEIRSASLGGWDPFGPERIITRSEGNVLFELDGQSALGLYKRYLDEHADGLPATGLLFPLAVRSDQNDKPITHDPRHR